MVRRLVEHEQVRFHHQKLGEVGAHDPAAGIFAGWFVEILGFEAESVEDFFCFRLQLVAVERGELVLSVSEIRVGKVAGFLVFPHRAEDSDHFRGDPHGDFENSFIRRFARFLGEITGDRIFVALDRAFVRAVLIEDHAEKSGLAGTVRADEGDAFAPVDRHPGFAEQRAAAEGLGKIFNRKHARGVKDLAARGKEFERGTGGNA